MAEVQRGPDGAFRWVRPARLHQNKVLFVEERHRHGGHGGNIGDRSTGDHHTRRGLPSFRDVERLLGIYVASGEGQGAFLAAKASERTKGFRYLNVRRNFPPGTYGSSDDSSDPPSDGSPPVIVPHPPGPPDTSPGSATRIHIPEPAHTGVERNRRRTEMQRERERHQEVIRPLFEMRREREHYQEARNEPSPEIWEHRVHVDEGRPIYTDSLPQEDDIRRRRSSGLRGGGGAEYDPKEAPSDGDGPNSLRLRGGGNQKEEFKEIDKTPKEINLFFCCTSQGEIISSQECELYTTFQELQNTGDEQSSDRWLVSNLHWHYDVINRQQQSFLWNLISMRTIGFATFIRFQSTVHPDNLGYIVSATEPAVSAEGEATSHFQHLMKHPLRSKLMLFKLDKLAAETRNDPRDSQAPKDFYVVQIKEAPDTTKIYILFILIILVSTGGGVAYAVVKHDPSTGLSISTYVLTCLTVILTVFSVGEFLGLKKLDSFSFAYDVETNQVLSAPYATQVFGPGWDPLTDRRQ